MVDLLYVVHQNATAQKCCSSGKGLNIRGVARKTLMTDNDNNNFQMVIDIKDFKPFSGT